MEKFSTVKPKNETIQFESPIDALVHRWIEAGELPHLSLIEKVRFADA